MHNNLRAAWWKAGGAPERSEPADGPIGRLAWLFAVTAASLLVIGGRLAYVQCVLPDGLTETFEQTTESVEAIPARDGRILAADGVVLADNQERFDLLVYYRWIENPPNPEWVKHRAQRSLTRSERRHPDRLAEAETEVRERHAELWRALVDVLQVSEEDLERQRERVQARVEHIWDLVEAKRTQRETRATESTSGGTVIGTDFWSRFWQELTTPPPRQRNDPLIISEQEDDHILWEGIGAEAAAEIEAHPERYPGARVVIRSRRVYPERTLAAHLIGSRTRRSPEDIADSPGPGVDEAASPDQQIGRSGLERSYEEHLRGRPGLKRIIRNRRREIVQTEIVREPHPGRDLIVTFTANLQGRTEQLLNQVLGRTPAAALPGQIDDESNRQQPAAMVGPRGACVVALDVHTGAVLTAAAAPSFDLNLLVETDEAQWQALLADPRRPLFPRVTQMALPPGSTFKTLSAMALVEDGQLDPKARFVCQGFLDRPDKDRCLVFRHYGVGHNDTDLADALCRSCNVYFFTAARRAGPRPLIEWSQKLGFGQPTGIDLPGEAVGSLPMPDADQKKSRRPWYAGDTLGLAIGQSSLLVTPLQMARLMAAVANEGQLVTPYLGAAAGAWQQQPTGSPPSTMQRFVRPEPRAIAGLHPDTLAVVREGLERVVQDPKGTAYKTVRLPNIRSAGKTGTAEVGSRLPDHAWFAGYVPADAPRVAFVVVVEHGGSGGKVAGPIARDFIKLLAETGVVSGSRDLAKE
ncbi:MAG: penicillin-binding transpeptidase domain-containing protein [Planctomycetaceae bacterium]